MQIGSRVLYDRLLGIGLVPRKSLTIPALKIPDAGFRDFLRGVIDGDGNIHRWRHPTNGREQWTIRIYSASEPFLRWIVSTVERLWRVRGRLHQEIMEEERLHTKYTLKFGKLAAKVILSKCYYPDALALDRKRELALECVRAKVGWSRSQTVANLSDWRDWTYAHGYRTKVISKVLNPT